MAEAGEAGSESLDELVEKALSSKEPLQKPKAEPIKPQSLLEKILLSDSTAPIYAAALGLLYYTLPTPPSFNLSEKGAFAALLSGLGIITQRLMRQDWLISKAEAIQSRVKPLPLKFLRAFSDYPKAWLLAAGAYAAYMTASMISPFLTSLSTGDFVRYPQFITTTAHTAPLSALTYFSLGYSALSLALGRIFHPETAKTLYKVWAAVHNAERERYQQAVNDLEQLLETQRSYGKAVVLQAVAADLQLLNNDDSFLDTFYNAVATEKTSHAAKLQKSAQPVAHPYIQGIVTGTEAFAVGNLKSADSSFLSAVEQGRNEFLPHAFRAAFLRRTGRHATADLEMRVCAELLMLEQNLEFERVEGSRNEVFFAGNVALKRNTDHSPLEEELGVITKFRERFGQSVIYPLPVYKRGDFYYLLSEKDISETLLDLIRQRKARFEDFAHAIQLLVQLQKFGLDTYKAGVLPLDDRILQIDSTKPETMYFTGRRQQAMQQIEKFNGIKLPDSYKAAVGSGLAFVDKVLASSPFLTMYKDFNPKNILKRLFGQTQVLDFELRSLKLLPAQTDLVNLFEFTEYLPPEHIRRLLDLAADMFARENRIKIDKKEFTKVYEFAAFQWHYERLIYRPEESAAARTEEQREAKKKEQVYHLAKAREHLDTIVAMGYVGGDDLESALKAKEELKHTIFPTAEQEQLEAIVAKERKEAVLKEPLPISKTRLALASAGVSAVLAAFIIGAVSVRNNLIPFINVPVFPQSDKVLLAVSGESEGVTRQHRGFQEKQFLSINYYVIDADSDRISFLTAADDTLNTSLSEFQDKAAFIKDGHVVLYDFIKRQFRTVEDDRFQNPAISPNGLWIASHVRKAYIDPIMTELWFIRPADTKTRQTVNLPNSYLPPRAFGNSWSKDGSYLIFLSNNEKVKDSSHPDPFKVWINSLNFSTGQVSTGPFISDRGRGIFSWASNGTLAYIVEREGQKPQVHLTDPDFRNDRVVYAAEGIGDIEFVGHDNLVINSILLTREGFKFAPSILDLKTLKLTTLDGSYLEDVSKDGSRILYDCGVPLDICEFDLEKGISRNLTGTPLLKEPAAVYSPDGRKIYVVAYPAEADCNQSCPPSLFAIDLQTGKSRLLRHDTNGKLRYSLITK
ncbi:hypothetical protein HYU20_00070 [Candidatus Woesearchaeota archaeon]|nr:hypothetical protein [Candidatus Woesearchaeota archaeon]